MSSNICSCPGNASYCVLPVQGTILGIYNQPFNLPVYICNNTTTSYTGNLQLLDQSGNVVCQLSNLDILSGVSSYTLTGCKITSTPGVTQTWTLQLSLSGGITVQNTVQVHAIDQKVTFFYPYQMCCVLPNQAFTVQEICTTPAGGTCPGTQIAFGKTYTVLAPVGLPPLFTFTGSGISSNETITITVTYYFTNGNTYVVTRTLNVSNPTAYIRLGDVLSTYQTNGSVSYVTINATSSLGGFSIAQVVYAAYVPCACGTPLQVSVPYQISVTLYDNATTMAQVYAVLTTTNNILGATTTTVQPAIPPASVPGSFNITTVQPLSLGIIPAMLYVYASNYNTPDAMTYLALGIQSGTGIGSFAIVANCGSYYTCPCNISVSIQNLTSTGVTGYVVAYYDGNQVKSNEITLDPGQQQTVQLTINTNATTDVTVDFVDASTGNVLATTSCTVNVTGFTPILNTIVDFVAFALMSAVLGMIIQAIRRRRRSSRQGEVIIVH